MAAELFSDIIRGDFPPGQSLQPTHLGFGPLLRTCPHHFPFTFSPSSTRRRMASESDGVSGCFSAHRTMDARITGSARKPINGVMPVRGRPMTLCLTGVAFFILFV